MSKGKKAKPRPKKAVKKHRAQRVDIVIHSSELRPTADDLAVPIRDDNKKLTIAKTWITAPQIIKMVEKTPPQHVYQRPGKGGGKWDYVTVSYMQRVLDYVFGWNWDFEIVEHGKEKDHVWVLGRLTVHSPDGKQSIRKQQFGRSDVKQKREGGGDLDYGNDLKAAASDALKKCASMFGIARDIYSKVDYKMESGAEPRETAVQAIPQANMVEAPTKEFYCHGARKSGCPAGNEISQSEAEFTIRMYGKQLCRSCAKESRPIKK